VWNNLSKSSRIVVGVLAGNLAAITLVWFIGGRESLPAPGSEPYEQITRAFYRGLASLEVGLLDDAKREFTSATVLVPEEPASWANLGLTHLRLGELDVAAEPIARALALAPDDADLVLLAGRMEIARGRLDEGVAHLRRATDLEPGALRARFALADEVERAAGPDADAQALALLDELSQLAPDNAAVLVERARVAAKARDSAKLADSIRRLEPMAAAWPQMAADQFRALQAAFTGGDFARAALATTFLRNVLASVPSFIEHLTAVRTPTELIAEPIATFVRLTAPTATPAAPDTALSFVTQPRGGVLELPEPVISLPSPDGNAPDILIGYRVLREGAAAVLLHPSLTSAPPGADAVRVLDWNNDFRNDVAVAAGDRVTVYVQMADGVFAPSAPEGCDCSVLWAADVEMDGDLDLIAGSAAPRPPVVLRNNGDGTATRMTLFAGVNGVRGFAWADVDGDADPDAAILDGSGQLRVFRNRQAGDFVTLDVTADSPADRQRPTLQAIAAADIDADGMLDVLTLDDAGQVRRLTRRGDQWETAAVVRWEGFDSTRSGHRLLVADLDNNGALDLIAAGGFESRIWLADERHQLAGLQATPEGEIFAVADFNADGRLDLLARAGAPAAGRQGDAANPLQTRWQPAVHINRGTKAYHWKVIRPRAQPNAGDQRINSFAVGGDIEVRSGLLVQKQLLTGGPVHVGLGERTSIDVARIVWPNGVAQAEFGVGVDDGMVAEQRLKGSCPWVFAWDGTGMRFVTDFLWRSPLGLRINAQDTAGVTQTEDWVKISAAQLAPHNGAYDLRITAELWETHFFDHVSLMVVDHPVDTEVYVDERFSPVAPPALAVHAVQGRRAVAAARDHRGLDATELVARRDGRYLARFARGTYQGIAEEHFVEFEVPDDMARANLRLLASGWIYPTDSSINVAIAQGGKVRPMGLSLEAQDANGRWSVVSPDLGFPAGKNKTVIVDLSGADDARRFRLRTNLEIAWDALELATLVERPLRTTTLRTDRAELRYRGFSQTTSPRGDAPETPDYDRLASRSQRWRDLEGYHTRFGDVQELLEGVDDRYVIMNAGDELRLLFREQAGPAAGWTRDFVLIGDGWEKDGDYNTGFSQTVLPLPSHDKPDYGAGVTSLELADDPVYQRHRDDWQRYHTRYVTPRAFVNGLRTTKSTKTD
jgi:tetratricopeptide (TPR) repeat protein